LEELPPKQLNYAESFRCIGPACEDTCCQGWKVPIDREAFERFRSLPAGPLRSLIDDSLDPRLDPRLDPKLNGSPPASSAPRPAPFAVFRMVEGNRCPLLTPDRLCRIQSESGPALLPHACATYPRMVHTLEGVAETGLTLSCPEAARLVLLNPDLLADYAADRAASPTDPNGNFPAGARRSSKAAVRDTILRLAANRNYPLWQRLFLIGVLCRRLDLANAAANDLANAGAIPSAAVPAGSRDSDALIVPPGLLASFGATADPPALRSAMATLPFDDLIQLEAVLRLAGLMLHKSNVSPRFVECTHAFTTGLGNQPGATLASLAGHYAGGCREWFAPFFAAHPHILENLLVNSILCLNFPFASEKQTPGPGHARPRPMGLQFAVLAAQFALFRGLLIGVAGYHRQRFSTEHVVHTVQSASKHFEHHPGFAGEIEALLAELRLDDARGLTLLLHEPTGSPTVEQVSAEALATVQSARESLKPDFAPAPAD
jgi:lysine-N-methylase